jgi:hypothetical protein
MVIDGEVQGYTINAHVSWQLGFNIEIMSNLDPEPPTN